MNEETRNPKALLTRGGLQPKKHFGQNFLADGNLASKIAEHAAGRGGTIVEIGAGLGALTKPLLDRADKVIAIERDRDLVPMLNEVFASEIASGKLQVLEADAKTAEYEKLFEDGPRPHVLAGNLPYQITGPLLQRTAQTARALDRAVFLVQLEVADRLASLPGTSDYGAASVFLQAQFTVSKALVARRGAFYPQPGVDSALVVLETHAEPLARETEVFRALVSRAFAQRRKTLRNAWRGVLSLDVTELETAAARAGIDLMLRGERLAVTDFARMAAALGDAEQPHGV
jgi:16S rRNA (adenine1518-N6/adenine1519-N6)-dimethyltransferase